MAKKIALILLMFIAFSPYFSSARAQTFRTTTFDDRQACQENKGIWREFGNGCVDDCASKFDKYVTCTKELKYACDCGRGRCWNEGKCFTIDAYTKIYNKESDERAKVLEAKKKEREERIKNDPSLNNYLQNLYIQKAATTAGGAPAAGANGAPAGQPAPPQQPNAITQAAPVRDLPTSPDGVTQVPAVVAPTTPAQGMPTGGSQQQVPPMFLEKEKQDQEKQRQQQQQQNSGTAGTPVGNPTGKDAPVALPSIPLPN